MATGNGLSATRLPGARMNPARSGPKAFLFLLLMLTGTRLWAGPPFQTDDPEPVDFRHYELYQFGTVSSTPVETDPTGPAIEFNWGAAPNLQVHVILPFGAVLPSNNPIYRPGGIGPSAYGLTDTELGVKYRFVKETKHRPQIGTFPMFELPTGSYSKDLGVGKVWYKLPVWIQKSWGEWTAYGGAGYQVVPQTQYRNFFYTGWLLQRNIGKKLTLGAEVFFHRKEGFATSQTQSSTMVDFGGTYCFKNPGFQLLFAYGHSVFGQTENYAYLGLYQIWGGTSGKAPNGFLSRLFSSHARE
jgi:Putative MetA-pathway of phenol degradation